MPNTANKLYFQIGISTVHIFPVKYTKKLCDQTGRKTIKKI